MTYGFGRSSYGSSRARVCSFRGGSSRGTYSNSYYNSSYHASSTKLSFHGCSTFNYRNQDDHRDSRGTGQYRCGMYDPYPTSTSHSRRDEESSSHRRETRESSSGSYNREHSQSRRSDGESDRKRMRTNVGGSLEDGYPTRRSYDEPNRANRSLDSSSSSPYRSHSSSFAGSSYKKDFNDFKKPLPPSDRSGYSRRPTRSIRGRSNNVLLWRRNPAGRFAPTSRLQLSLRKKKQTEITRMRKNCETRRLYAEDHLKNSSTEEQPNVDKNVNMEKNSGADDGPAGVPSSSTRSPRRHRSGSSPQKNGSQSKLPEFGERQHSSFQRTRRIALKCPHCRTEYKMFRSYQAHLMTPTHKAAMEKLLRKLTEKLRHLRMDQRKAQRVIDERDGDFSQKSYCKLCKLHFQQSRREHIVSDFHISMLEFFDSRCKICHINFATPLLYEHHRCTLTHIKRKDFLKRKSVLEAKNRDEDNNDDESFMVLDSVGSDDESNEEVASKENTDSSKKTSPEAKKKTTIIGKEFIKTVDVYYCKLCKLCLHYNPNRDAEDGLLSHCRSRFHLKRFSLEDAKKHELEKKISGSEDHSAQKKFTSEVQVEVGDANIKKEQFSADDEVLGNGYKSSGDENDANLGNRFDRFSTSDENNINVKIKVEPKDNNEPMGNSDAKQIAVVKSVPI